MVRSDIDSRFPIRLKMPMNGREGYESMVYRIDYRDLTLLRFKPDNLLV